MSAPDLTTPAQLGALVAAWFQAEQDADEATLTITLKDGHYTLHQTTTQRGSIDIDDGQGPANA